MGPAQADRALDNPYLAVRVGYWRSSLLSALPMVPSTRSLALKRPLSSADYHATISSMLWAPARYSDEPANHSDVKILRSTAI